MGRIAKPRSSDGGDCCVPPARAVWEVGRGGFAHHDLGVALWRRAKCAFVHSAAPHRLVPGVADSHTVMGPTAKRRSSDVGDCCVPPAQVVGRGGLRAQHDLRLALWRRQASASVHSAAPQRLMPGVADSHT
eukprot:3001148-Prymnesium_polylepis.1